MRPLATLAFIVISSSTSDFKAGPSSAGGGSKDAFVPTGGVDKSSSSSARDVSKDSSAFTGVDNKASSSSAADDSKASSSSAGDDNRDSSTSSSVDSRNSTLSAGDDSKDFSTSTGVDGKDLSTPDDGRVPSFSGDVGLLQTSIRWSNFASVDEPGGQLHGSLSVEYSWHLDEKGSIPLTIGDVHDVVVLTNFATGNVGRVKTATFRYGDFRRSSMIYVGSFHQQFDGTCYPWDTQNIIFDFDIPRPFSKKVYFGLYCNYEDVHCSVKSSSGKELPRGSAVRGVSMVHRFTDGMEIKGFAWSALTCSLVTKQRIHCAMTAARIKTKAIVLEVIPGVVMLFIGFGSFLIPVNLAMPRVGTTMIALLTFVGRGSIVMESMPEDGMSIVEEFYIWGMVAMMLNMLGHIYSWRYSSFSPVIDDLSLSFAFFSLALVLAASLHARACPLLTSTATGGVVALVSVLFSLSVLGLLWRNRETLMRVRTSVRELDLSSVVLGSEASQKD